jgi:GrpB-like predicted nucleotidyltransferase (UPF0157 family)/uridine kinase
VQPNPVKLGPLLRARPAKVGQTLFIAIDGHGGSGKSTLATHLSSRLRASVIRTDDFAAWNNPLDWWPLVIRNVFRPIQDGVKTLSYDRSRWWEHHRPEPVVDRPVTSVMILEGVSSCRKEFRDYISLSIFVDTPRAVCLQRGVERDRVTGKTDEELVRIWEEWFGEEDRYLQRHQPKAYADVVVDGTRPFDQQIDVDLEAQPTGSRPPLTEEQIRAAHVGEVKPLHGRVMIVDYDPQWAELFEREAVRIRSAFAERALQIEHVGSTSVPGLPAKPIIDIVLAVTDSADETAYVGALAASGYRLQIREPDWYEHRMFKGPDTDINLHTFSAGCPEIDRMLIFRNWLRVSPTDRQLYTRTKLDLAQREWTFGQNYADAKSAVIDGILARARRDRS